MLKYIEHSQSVRKTLITMNTLIRKQGRLQTSELNVQETSKETIWNQFLNVFLNMVMQFCKIIDAYQHTT